MIKRLAMLFMVLTLFLPVSVRGNTIKITAPGNGKKVSMVDRQVRSWHDSKKRIPPKYKKDHATPSGVTLKWKKIGQNYKVFLSKNKMFLTAEKHETTNNQITYYNLRRNQTYYWKITADLNGQQLESKVFSFHTKNYPRLIKVNKVSNIRDLGGYKVKDGTVKQGMIYRSANMDSIKKSGKKTIKKLGIRTDLDLRNNKEGLGGTSSPANLGYIHIPGVMYEEIIDSEANKKQLVKECRVFARESNYPILFHCTYGRDRTGTLAFMINGLLGVGKKNLYKDYALTFLSSKRGDSPSKRIKRFDRLFKYMASYKNKKKPLSYNIQAFLLDYGMTKEEIRTIKQLMIEK